MQPAGPEFMGRQTGTVDVRRGSEVCLLGGLVLGGVLARIGNDSLDESFDRRSGK